MKLGDVGGCPGHQRHWYALYGHPGMRSPVCVRCGADNPRELTDEEWGNLIYLAGFGSLGKYVDSAIAAFERDVERANAGQ